MENNYLNKVYDVSTSDSRELYASWATTYDQEVIDNGYATPDRVAKALKEYGAKEIYSYIAHGVLSGEALNRIENSAIKELVLTDSIHASNEVKNTKNIRHISIAPLMGEAIKRINSDSSVSALFD